MKVKNIGIDIDSNTIIDKTYRTWQSKQYVKICDETNFKTGHIAFEDGIFLPENTFVLIKENGKPDVLGKIFYYDCLFQEKSDLYHNVAIVDIHYDMNSNRARCCLNDSLIKAFINKDIYIQNRDKPPKYLQVVEYEYDKDDDWKLVKVEYGNPGVKMFYMYGYQYYDKEIYEKKDVKSKKLFCLNDFHIYKQVYEIDECNVGEEINEDDIKTNQPYKVKPNELLLPGESELILLCLLGMGITFVFKVWYLYWIVIVILFIIQKKKIREKYNG